MTRLTIRFGLLLGMGRHCPVRRLARLALIGALVAAALYGAGEAREIFVQLAEARNDRASLLAHLNGTPFVEDKPDGTRVYTHAATSDTAVRPLIAGLK